MPWQIVVSLVLIGLSILPAALTAVLTFSLGAALPSLIWTALGICIAARLDRARNIAMALNLLNILVAVLVAFGVAPLLGGIDVVAIASGAFSLGMIFLLGSEPSKAYTYKVGRRSFED